MSNELLECKWLQGVFKGCHSSLARPLWLVYLQYVQYCTLGTVLWGYTCTVYSSCAIELSTKWSALFYRPTFFLHSAKHWTQMYALWSAITTTAQFRYQRGKLSNDTPSLCWQCHCIYDSGYGDVDAIDDISVVIWSITFANSSALRWNQ